LAEKLRGLTRLCNPKALGARTPETLLSFLAEPRMCADTAFALKAVMASRYSLLFTALFVALLAPAGARAQAPNSHLISPDRLSQVSPHVWVIKGFPNIGIVVGKDATLVVDTGLGTRNGKIVADTARRLSPNGQKLYLTTTHYHAEHASGDGGFPPGTVVVRPRPQQEEMEAEGQKLMDLFSSRSEEDRALLADAHINPANILFDGSYQLDLGGGVNAQLFWFGGAHTKGDELILVAPDSVLFSGDVVQNKTGPYFYCDDCTPRSWLAVLNQVARLSPSIVVPDHSDVGDGTLIAQERDMMAYLASRIAALKASGASAEQASATLTAEVKEKYPGWGGFTHLDQAVQHVYGVTAAP
jgi:glyoxylase-like metal-dependent hydrolase (beta-lactamase superfamily II)